MPTHTISENLQRLTAAKTAISTAITNKGGTVAQGDGLEEFASDIASIPTGVDTSNDTVTAATLKSGYTAHNAAGEQITGTLIVPSGMYNWAYVQQKVRNNDMADIPVKDLFSCMKEQNELTLDVIGKNIDTPSNTKYSNTLTLKTHYALTDGIEFDAPEAFYYCQTELTPGTYYFTYYNGSYTRYTRFVTSKTVPAGGQLVFSDNSMTSTYIYSYSSPFSTTPIETIRNNTGSGGTNLGEIYDARKNGKLNAYNRCTFGNERWKESAIRQWANSDKPAGEWWSPQNNWDRPPSYANTLNGFMYGLDADFKAVLGLTKKTTIKSTAEGGGSDITSDTFFLLSQKEVNGKSGAPSEGTAYSSFYTSQSSRITYKQDGTTTTYFLRTIDSSTCGYVAYVASDGATYATASGNTYTTNAKMSKPVVLACNII